MGSMWLSVVGGVSDKADECFYRVSRARVFVVLKRYI
jgi:hypothetical protein